MTLLLLAACGGTAKTSEDPTTARFDPVAPTFAPLTTGADSAVPPPTQGAPNTTDTTDTTTVTGGDPLAGVIVAAESSGAGYDRELFDHWIDADHDGCDTRCEVLAQERRSDLPGLASGWLSIYDGYSTDDPSELDVDHVVALAEAWRSGADRWDAARRRAFANDLEEPDALIAVTASTNRSKSDRDPASWQPPNRESWCQFAAGWVRVKIKWGLSADEAEVSALRNMLAGCA